MWSPTDQFSRYEYVMEACLSRRTGRQHAAVCIVGCKARRFNERRKTGTGWLADVGCWMLAGCWVQMAPQTPQAGASEDFSNNPTPFSS
jgi:hypothetical protein